MQMLFLDQLLFTVTNELRLAYHAKTVTMLNK